MPKIAPPQKTTGHLSRKDQKSARAWPSIVMHLIKHELYEEAAEEAAKHLTDALGLKSQRHMTFKEIINASLKDADGSVNVDRARKIAVKHTLDMDVSDAKRFIAWADDLLTLDEATRTIRVANEVTTMFVTGFTQQAKARDFRAEGVPSPGVIPAPNGSRRT